MDMKEEIKIGNYVKMKIGGNWCFGTLSSIEKGIANITGLKQVKFSKPAYHYPIEEIVECSHKEIEAIGRDLMKHEILNIQIGGSPESKFAIASFKNVVARIMDDIKSL